MANTSHKASTRVLKQTQIIDLPPGSEGSSERLRYNASPWRLPEASPARETLDVTGHPTLALGLSLRLDNGHEALSDRLQLDGSVKRNVNRSLFPPTHQRPFPPRFGP